MESAPVMQMLWTTWTMQTQASQTPRMTQQEMAARDW
jgi:hypothetical protein